MVTGIFGGSFNPIHNGHIAIARQLLAMTDIEEVWFMVSPHNPLKQHDCLIDDAIRLAMTGKALEEERGMVCSDYEFRLPRPSYTWHTLQSLSRDYPQRRFTLIIGADNWHSFPRWYNPTQIIANYPIVIYPRRGFSIDRSSLPDGVTYLDMDLHDISATQIRQMVRQGSDISALVPRSIVTMVYDALHDKTTF